MAKQTVRLEPVTREDVARIGEWLADDEVAESWFGRYSYGDPAHLGYNPHEVASADADEWERTFSSPDHRILSVATESGEHIGEVHVAIEEALGDGQLSILIGRKDLWHKGYGTAAADAALDRCFNDWGLYRVWGGCARVQQVGAHDVRTSWVRPRGHATQEPATRGCAFRLSRNGNPRSRVRCPRTHRRRTRRLALRPRVLPQGGEALGEGCAPLPVDLFLDRPGPVQPVEFHNH